MKYHVNAIIDDDFWQLVKHEKLQEGELEVESAMNIGSSHWCQSTPRPDHWSILDDDRQSTSPTYHRSTKSTESVASSQQVRIMTHKEFAAWHPHPPTFYRPSKTDIDRQPEPGIDRHRSTTRARHRSTTTNDRHEKSDIDWRAPLTYWVQWLKIDVPTLNAFRNRPKPSEIPIDDTCHHSEEKAEPMQVNQNMERRSVQKRKKKVPKHFKKGVNEKEMDSFTKWVMRIPVDKPFEEAYFKHKLWIFFKETMETEQDIIRMFHEVISKMKKRITPKKHDNPGKFAVPCLLQELHSQVHSATLVLQSAYYTKLWQTN